MCDLATRQSHQLTNEHAYLLTIVTVGVQETGADPGFFPRGGGGGPVGHSATKTRQASQGKVRRGGGGFGVEKIWNMKCSRSDSEQTSGTLEIRAIFLGTLLQFCENSEERVQSQIRNFMV